MNGIPAPAGDLRTAPLNYPTIPIKSNVPGAKGMGARILSARHLLTLFSGERKVGGHLALNFEEQYC